jgi:hypothetical protein
MPLFDTVSIAWVMVLECYVCDERGLCRVYVKFGTNVNYNPKGVGYGMETDLYKS